MAKIKPPKEARLMLIDFSLMTRVRNVLRPFGVTLHWSSWKQDDDQAWVWVTIDKRLRDAAEIAHVCLTGPPDKFDREKVAMFLGKALRETDPKNQ